MQTTLVACLILLFTTTNTFGQALQQVSIGASGGTSNFWFGPIYRNTGNSGLLNFSRHAYIYTAAELNIPSGSKIVALEWLKKDGATISGNNTFQVWLSNTTNSAFPSTASWNSLVINAQQVFNSSTYSILGVANTYVSAALTDTFTYQGGHIQILTNWGKFGVASAAVPFYVQTASGKSIGIAGTAPLTGSTILQSANYGGARPTLRISYLTVPPCSGIPAPGQTLTTKSTVCPGVPFTLSLQNEVPGTGISYEWQKADDSLFTLNVQVLGSSPNITLSQNTQAYYRCKLTCASGSGTVGFSIPTLIMMSPSYGCYCNSSPLSDADPDIFRFRFGQLQNCSDCSTLSPGANSIMNMYSNYQYLTPISVEKGSSIPYTIEIGTCGTTNNPNRCAIFIDYNKNNSFTDPGELVYSSASPISGAHTESGFITIPISAQNGLTGLRVINAEQNAPITDPCGYYSWGETEDYVINISNAGVCSGMPSPGQTTAEKAGSCTLFTNTVEVCSGGSLRLSCAQSNLGSGITYQWRNNNIPIPGATLAVYQTLPIISDQNYSCMVTCQNSGLSSLSTPILVTMSNYLNCYCLSKAGGNTEADILSVTLNGTAFASSCIAVASGAGSILNQYSNFTNQMPFSPIELGSTIPFEISVNDCDVPPAPFYTFTTMIWIDFNHNASFSDPGELVFSDPMQLASPRIIAGNINIPCIALEGNTRMRISIVEGLNANQIDPCMTYGFGETEDYLITLIPASRQLAFTFGSTAAPTANATSGLPAANLTVSPVSAGNNANIFQSGLLMNSVFPSNYPGASAQSRAGITARNISLTNDSSAFFQINLQPASGYRIVVDSIAFGSLSHSNGPTNIQIKSNLNNFAGSVANRIVLADSNWTFQTMVLPNVSSTTPLQLRIYGSVPGGPGTVISGNQPANWFIDDVRLFYSIKCISPCLLSGSASFSPISCFGGTTTMNVSGINGSGNMQYQINGGPTQTNGTFTGLAAGTYSIVITDANACTTSLIRIIPQPIVPNSYTLQTACNAYTWPINGVTYTGSGVYISNGLTPEGCTRHDTLQLTVNYTTNPATVVAIACGNYTWLGQTYTQSGFYTVTTINSNGCQQTNTLNLTITPSTTNTTVINACGSYVWPLNGVTYTASGNYQYINACQINNLNLTITSCPPTFPFAINLLLQGYYTTNGQMRPVLQNQGISANPNHTDSISVELRNPVFPYSIVYSGKVILSTTGVASVLLPFSTGSYYIVVKHRNTLETWSALPVQVSTGSYSFINTATSAFGSNMTQVQNGKWAMYTGDLNADGNIDLLDNTLLSAAISSFISGYSLYDLNGDGNVDLLDNNVLEMNISNFVFTIKP